MDITVVIYTGVPQSTRVYHAVKLHDKLCSDTADVNLYIIITATRTLAPIMTFGRLQFKLQRSAECIIRATLTFFLYIYVFCVPDFEPFAFKKTLKSLN